MLLELYRETKLSASLPHKKTFRQSFSSSLFISSIGVSSLVWLENHSVKNSYFTFVKKTIEIVVAKGVKFRVTFVNTSNLFCAFLPLNIFILYLVDFFVDFGIELCNNEVKYSSETSAKRDSAAIVLVFKAGAFRY